MPSRVEQLRVQSRSASPPNRTRSTNWERTAVGHDEVHLILKPGEELPTVPYKLRFALSPDEWDRRLHMISFRTEKAASPLGEAIYFFTCCIALPAGIGYPLFLACRWAVTHDGHQKKVKATTEDKIYAYLIPCLLALFLFLLFLIPLFIRKYVLQRRMNRETKAWETMDLRKLDKKADAQWRVRLPVIFGSTAVIRIPVPPRSDDDTSSTFTFHSRQSSWEDVEALGGAGLARSDTNCRGQRTMFEHP